MQLLASEVCWKTLVNGIIKTKEHIAGLDYKTKPKASNISQNNVSQLHTIHLNYQARQGENYSQSGSSGGATKIQIAGGKL